MSKTPLQEAYERIGWTDEFARDLNAVLRAPETTAMGGYSLGVFQYLVERSGLSVFPDREAMERVARCERLADAVLLIEAWIAEKRAGGGA